MANPEHLELLKQGTKAVAAWRKERSDVWLDLSEAELRGADLAQTDLSGSVFRLAALDGANLAGANLTEATLHGATLKGAHLSGANLKEADLSLANLSETDLGLAFLSGAFLKEADLSRANLPFANLRGAILTSAVLAGAVLKEADLRDTWLFQADLRRADLRQADLTGAKLDKALLSESDLTGSRCGGTLFAQLDLSEVAGLETVQHLAPSTIGLDTLYLSKGRIAKAFLRGAGVPEEAINTFLSLARAQGGLPFTACIISHGPKDQEFAERLGARLREENLRVWESPEDIPGWKTPESTEPALNASAVWLLVISKSTLTSDWVGTEVRRAKKAEARRKCKLMPVRLVDQDTLKRLFQTEAGQEVGTELNDYPIPDFSQWKDPAGFDSAFNRLLKELRAAAAPEGK
jgi:uncharacterized protein YjbI with pentapeptide repeats